MKEYSPGKLNDSGESFGDLIREYRRRRGLSQEQLGALVRVKKNAVGAWESGRSRPDIASVPTLCRELGIPLQVFFGVAEKKDPFRLLERFVRLNEPNRTAILRQMDLLFEMQNRNEAAKQPETVSYISSENKPAPVRLVRLYRNDLSAAAGPFSYLEETHGDTVYLVSDDKTERADEIIRVSGDSMEPAFYDGDQVLIQHTDRLREGEIGIFINGDAGYIKEYRRDGLYSFNRRYAPIRFSENDSVRCIGRVLGVLKPEQYATMEEIAAFTRGHF